MFATGLFLKFKYMHLWSKWVVSNPAEMEQFFTYGVSVTVIVKSLYGNDLTYQVQMAHTYVPGALVPDSRYLGIRSTCT